MNTLYHDCSSPKVTHTLMAFVVLLTANVAKAQVRLVADLDPLKYETGYTEESKFFTLHVTDGKRSFFVANGSELWTSDGTTDGTRIVKRFLNVTAASVLNSVVYFAAHTDEMGIELWRSDGTPSGTVLVKDIYPGRGNSSPSDFVKAGNVLYFSANNKVNGRELWKTDGTPVGTQLVTDINPGAASSGPNKLAVLNNTVFFSADDGVHGTELWSSNGTAGGTRMIRDINTGMYGSVPQDLVVANGLLFLTAVTNTDGRQLWKSNGTVAGTTLLKIINPGGTRIGRLTPADDLVFFEAADAAHGLELWRTDGTEAGTFIAKDLTPGPGSNTAYAELHLNNFSAVNGKLFFKAVAEYGPALWMSDGTPEGTIQIPVTGEDPITSWIDVTFYNINGEAFFVARSDWDMSNLYKSDMAGNITLVRRNISGVGNPTSMFISINGTHYFLSSDHYWKTDGTTAGTVRIKQIGFPAGSNPTQLNDMNGTLIFTTDGPDGLWRSEGTAASTTQIHASTEIMRAKNANGLLFFSGTPLTGYNYVPWRTDGTPEGTFILSTEAEFPYVYAAANGLVFFNASSDAHGEELWQSDGTVAGTRITKDINPGPGNTIPRTLLGAGNQVFFPIYTEGRGNELWRSDGTETGTYLVKDIYPGSPSSAPRALVYFKGKAYFFADDGVNGFELWRSDGSTAGTSMVKNINADDVNDQYDMKSMIATENHILFTAIDNGSMSLWRSDGTGANTFKIANLITEGDPVFLANAGDNVYFLLSFERYIELWKSDGSSTGTRKVHTFNDQYLGYGGGNSVIGDVLYFITTHRTNGSRFIWRSDGTTTGTYQIPFDGQPAWLAASGPYVYFNGTSRKYGSELFLIDEGLSEAREASQARVQVIDEITEAGVTQFPNPFQSHLSVSVNGRHDEVFDLEVLTVNGENIFRQKTLPCNTTHTFNANWSSGMYVMRINHNNRLITKKIVKIQD